MEGGREGGRKAGRSSGVTRFPQSGSAMTSGFKTKRSRDVGWGTVEGDKTDLWRVRETESNSLARRLTLPSIWRTAGAN